MHARRLLLSVVFAAFSLAAFYGCGGDSGGPTANPMVPTNRLGSSAQAESIPAYNDTLHSPILAAQLNVYRSEGFGSSGYPLEANDILYTAAVRHAGYLDSINSEDGSAGADGEEVVIEDSIEILYTEPVVPDGQSIIPPVYQSLDGASFPVFYTHNSLRNRVLAIGGGPAFLEQNVGERGLDECYAFTSDYYIWDTENDLLSDFRGRNGYSAAEALWYHPYWRIPLMRASVRHLGYGPVAQARAYTGVVPPFPLFNQEGAFNGVVTLAEDRYPSTLVVESLWPADGSTGIGAWGFNGVGDMTDTSNGIFSGPVLHYIADASHTIVEVDVDFDIVSGGGGNVALNTSGAGIPDSNDVPVNIYLAFQSAIINDNTDDSFSIDATADLFSATAAGAGGPGAMVNITLMSNVEIRQIDHPHDDTAPGPGQVNDILVDTWFPQYTEQVHVQFEEALDDEVMIGDVIEMRPYVEPLMARNPGESNDIYSRHTGRGTIAYINPSRDHVVLAFGDNLGDNQAYDEVIASNYNVFADTPDDTNAICDIVGLRDDAGSGNGVAALRNGEILAIPSCPLISGATYRFVVTLTDTAGNTHGGTTEFTVR